MSNPMDGAGRGSAGRMNCADCRDALTAFTDRELSDHELAAVREHVGACAECARDEATLSATRDLVRRAAPRYTAPDVLRARIRGLVLDEGHAAIDTAGVARGADGGARVAPAPAPASGEQRPAHAQPAWRRMVAVAAIALVAFGLGTTFTAYRTRAPGSESLVEQLVASHAQSLVPDHLIQVATSDRHTVKPWFNGRVAVSPPVPNLDSLGFPLIGGRVDRVAGREAAVVVYGRRKHIINAYAWPTQQADANIAMTTHAGFHVIHMRRQGTELWIVSDLAQNELLEFAKLYSP